MRIILLLLMSTLSSLSFGVAFESSVDRTTISEGESILLTVKYNSNIFSGNPDLSVLEKDFSVVSQNRKNNFQFINGKSNSWTIWTIALIPKSKGSLVIPSISFKGEKTQPITINVTKVSDAVKNQQKDVFFHTDVDIKTTYVQAQVIYTEKLYFSVPLENSQLSEVKVDRAPQTTFGISFDTKVSDDLSVDMRYNYFADQYGFIDIDNVFEASISNTQYEGEKLDNYGLMDIGVTYDFDAGSNDVRLRLNVYNLLDEVYYSTRQKYGYYYGPPRNFNLSLQYLF